MHKNLAYLYQAVEHVLSCREIVEIWDKKMRNLRIKED